MTHEEILQELIRICGGNQAELARKLDVSRQTITNWLQEGRISPGGVVAIARHFPQFSSHLLGSVA